MHENELLSSQIKLNLRDLHWKHDGSLPIKIGLNKPLLNLLEALLLKKVLSDKVAAIPV